MSHNRMLPSPLIHTSLAYEFVVLCPNKNKTVCTSSIGGLRMNALMVTGCSNFVPLRNQTI